MARILVVDDEKNITLVIEAMLKRESFDVLTFNDSAQALEALESEEFSAVITDLYMPGLSGMSVLQSCKQEFPQLPVIIITAYGTVESAVTALKAGAFDFIIKPFDQTELVNVVKKAVQTYRERQKEPSQPTHFLPQSGVRASFSSAIIGQSPLVQEMFRVIAKIAESPTTVLLLGESGTGKELVATQIHESSPRAKKPLIKMNCAAIPPALIESELFGHERGAFTGALSAKPGRFELAHEGTLFLDELAEMPLEMQVKLLRVLQESEFTRVGGVNPIRVDVRIIAATNQDLEALVQAGKFREDLFYRINVVPIRLPSLRERSEDIPLLVESFIDRFNNKLGLHIVRAEPQCLHALAHYNWPGNIRQLENAVERMVLMCDGDILKFSDLPEEIKARPEAAAYPDAKEIGFKEKVRQQTQAVERNLIEQALTDTQGNVTRAAEKLGLSRKGLQLKLKELGLRRTY